jgi:hypothetical protein
VHVPERALADDADDFKRVGVDARRRGERGARPTHTAEGTDDRVTPFVAARVDSGVKRLASRARIDDFESPQRAHAASAQSHEGRCAMSADDRDEDFNAIVEAEEDAVDRSVHPSGIVPVLQYVLGCVFCARVWARARRARGLESA